MISSHQKRKSQLEKLVEQAEAQLDDHHAGRNVLETEEFEKITKRVGLFKQKLEKMPDIPDKKVSNYHDQETSILFVAQ